MLGIDPSNTSCGLALIRKGVCVWSATRDPWDPNTFMYPGIEEDVELIAMCEGPRGSIHGSVGVHFAGGMVIRDLVRADLLKRKNLHKPKPEEWRRAYYGPIAKSKGITTERWKAMAKYEVDQLGYAFDSADEAEAILIGLVGWRTHCTGK